MRAPLTYRRDIDGLRSFALLSVILYHAVPRLIPSGFAGVDIFFVISGYLIGGIVSGEAKRGEFSFRDFYARRARRILPALILVTAFSLLTGLLILGTQEMTTLTTSALYALLGVSNLFFYNQTDYFAAAADTNPLLMTWSLGIEEQFYLVLPPLLLLTRSFPARVRTALLAAVLLVSFAISAYQAQYHPLAGFYLLPARAWELGAGVALAMFHARDSASETQFAESNLLGGLGLALMLASFFLFRDRTPFPGVAALVPVIGTLLLLHCRSSIVNRKLLGWAPLVGIGLISYSWYLWHWPLMAFARTVTAGSVSEAPMLAAAIASGAIAFLSWKYVERPFRRKILPARIVLPRYAVALAGCAALLLFTLHQSAFPQRLPELARRIEAMPPNLGDCLSDYGDDTLPLREKCWPRGAQVALLGDSHAGALERGLRHALALRSVGLAELTKPNCPPLQGYTRRSQRFAERAGECDRFMRAAIDAIDAAPGIRTVILAGFWEGAGDGLARKTGEGIPAVKFEAIDKGLDALVTHFEEEGKTVVVAMDVPGFEANAYQVALGEAIPLRGALARLVSRPKGRGGHIPLRDLSASERAVRQVAARHPRALLLDLFTHACPQRRGCPYAFEGIPLYSDNHHLSALGSDRVDWAPLIALVLRQQPL